MKLRHHSEQLQLSYVAASPDLDVNKVALSGFKLLASGYIEVLLPAILSFKWADWAHVFVGGDDTGC